jgi:PAS domain S-box-containing protein
MSPRLSRPRADGSPSEPPDPAMPNSETRLRIVQESSRIGSLLVADLDFDQVIQRVADEAAAACGATLGALFYSVPRPDGESDLFFALSGAPRGTFDDLGLPRRTDLLTPTFHGSTLERLADVALDPRHELDALHLGIPVKRLGVRSYLALPVSSRSGEVLGRLFVGHSEPGVFTEAHEVTLMGVAGHAAIAMANARLYRIARESRGELELALAAERSARIEAERALQEGSKRAALGAAVGVAMAGRSSLEDQLGRCAQAIVVNLDAALARIWTLDEASQILVLRASRGLYTHLDGPHGRVPVGALEIGLIARERAPHLTNDVLSDPRVGDKAWAAGEGLVAFAGYPLIVDERVVGVMAMFSRSPLGAEALHALGRVADAIALGINRRSSEELTHQLQQSKERYRSLIEATTQTVWIASPEGEMVGPQPGWAALTGQSQEQYQGHGWTLAVHPDDRAHTTTLWSEAVRSGELFVCEHRVRRHDGEWRYFRAKSTPVREPDGSIREWFGVHTDVTDKKLVEVERERLIAELKRSNEDLDQFAYVTSHDLKAPLRGIANLSQWVEEDLADKISEEGREQMRLLRGRVHRLEALINGILSYSRAGRIRERLETVNVGQLAREVVELLAPAAAVQVSIPANLPTIEAERVPLQQVLMNLLSNAIKHANKSDPRVSITCSESRDGYSFMVKDNGPGINPAFHQRIWIIFQTLEPRDKVEATGIGLSIVKKIVESRGGRVWIDSVPGAGAEFHFSWPARAKAPR